VHAWAEAYVRETGQWVLVENTPADGVPGGDSQFNRISSFGDMVSFAWRALVALVKSGRLREALLLAGGFLLDGVVRAVSNPGVASVLVLGLAWFLWRRLRRRGRNGEAGPQDEARAILGECLSRIERRLRKQGLERKPAWTLAEWRNAMAARPDGSRFHRIIGLLEQFERCRYRQESPSLGEARDFRRKLRAAESDAANP
jgi:hypothetical protein